MPIEPPPWQAKLVGLVTFWASLGALGLWGVGGFAAVCAIGAAVSLAIWNRLANSPDEFVVFAAKTMAAISVTVAVIVGALYLFGLA